MKKFKGDIVVVSIVLGCFVWLGLEANVVSKNNLENTIDVTEDTEYIDYRSFTKSYIKQTETNFYRDYFKEAEERALSIHNERLRQQEIERQAEEERLRKLEEDRLRKIEEEKQRKITEAKLLREKEKKEVVISRGEVAQTESDWMTFEATYYTPYCTGCSGVTAVGINARESITHNGYRIIATDPKVIPLWSLVEVVTPHESFKAIAGDTGGAIKGKRTDILVSTKKEAYAKGRHDVKVRVIKYGGKK